MDNIVADTGKVLIIDDDKLVNDLIGNILRRNYKINSYESAEAMLGAENMSCVDVVITDINLPGIDGIELLKRVQTADPNIPVILITGYSDIDIAIAALKSGAFDFILKPFKNDQIVISVQKAMESRRLLLENKQLMEELKVKNQELEILNKNIQSRNVAIENELDIASNLQKCLFPVTIPEIAGMDFYLKFKPVEKISGDFFDFLIFDENRFAIIFADVSGHGVPAALYSAMVKTAITSVRDRNQAPSEFVGMINRFLIEAQKKMSYNYVTLFYGLFDLEKEVISYCNAGIPSPAIIRNGTDLMLLEPTGPFVGIFESSEFHDAEVPIVQGDKLVFYTDGIFECTDKEDKIMGQKILIKLLQKFRRQEMHDIVESLFSEVVKFCGDSKYDDDITLLGMNYKGILQE